MRTELTLAETLTTLGLLSGLPRFVTSVGGAGDVLQVTADPRQVTGLPAALRMATRLAPAVSARLQVDGFADGVATIAVDASAGGLPAHKLLGLATGRVESVVARRRLPAGSVQVLPDARVALDVQRLLAARRPGTTVTGMTFKDGRVLLDLA